MNEQDIKTLARAIAKEPLETRIDIIEKLLTDLGKYIEKKDLEQKYVV